MIRWIAAAAALAICSSIGLMPATLAQENLVRCADENGYCRVPYPTRVFYGVPGRVTALDVGPQGVRCSNDTFGDPAPGRFKHCVYAAREVERAAVRDELRERMLEFRAACEDGDRRACVRLGIIIGENRERRAAWRRDHPELFFYER